LAFLDIGFCALLPLFYSGPIEYGGLGLSTPTIGLLLGLFGLANGVFQALFFAKLIRVFGPKKIYMAGVMGYLAIYAIFPFTHILARQWGVSPFVWILIALQLCAMIVVEMGFGEIS
jgi:MFS family permease